MLAALVLAAVLLLAAGPLFSSGILAAIATWKQPVYSHGYLIPLVTLAVIWQRRQRIVEAARHDAASWAGVGLVALGLDILLFSRMSLMQTPEAVGFVILVGGLGLASLGPAAMRYAWAPLAFLMFALPIPTTAYYLLSTKLQLISSEIGTLLLRLLGISVFREGNIIDLGGYQLQVAEACSGLRYLFPLAAFGFLCAWLYRAPLWARTLVLVSTAPITVLVNSLRLALTGVLVENGGTTLAEGFLHLFEGWTIFVLAVALLFAEMWLLNRLGARPSGLGGLLDFDRLSASDNPAPVGRRSAAARSSLLPLLACAALFAATLPALAWAGSRPEQIPWRPGLATFPLHLGNWRGQERSVDETSRGVLLADDYLLADFAAPGQAAGISLWIVYYESQARGGRIHSPRECLPGAGWEFAQLETVPAPDIGGIAPFHINRAMLAKGSDRMLVYYWYEQRGRRLTDEVWTKFYVLLDALTMRRSDGALVRMLTPILPGEKVETAERRLAAFFLPAYASLGPHVGR